MIRSEQPNDSAAIHRVNAEAFGQSAEAELVARIRASEGFDPTLSLVAEVDEGGGDTNSAAEEPVRIKCIVGHILLSPIHIDAGDGQTIPALALAPMAVLPEFQRRGIGSQLVSAGLIVARNRRHKIVIVLGHETYYPRFGFEPGSNFGITAPFDVPDATFMARALTQGALDSAAGVVRYPPTFDGV